MYRTVARRGFQPFLSTSHKQISNIIQSAGAGGYYDYRYSQFFTDSAGTTPAGFTDNVGYWSDLSGFGNHATQAGASSVKPTLTTDGVSFDGGDWLGANGLASIASGDDVPFSVIAKMHFTSISGSNRWLSWSNSGAGPLNYEHGFTGITGPNRHNSIRIDNVGGTSSVNNVTVLSLTNFETVTYIFSGTTISLWVNGTQTLNSVAHNVGTITLNQVTIGARRRTAADLFFTGLIRSLVIVSGAISDDNRRKIEKLLV